MAEESIWVGELRTGRRITQIPVSSAKCTTALRGGDDIEVVVSLDAAEFRTYERRVIDGLYPSPLLLPDPDLLPRPETPVWRPGDGLRAEFLSAIDPARCFLAYLDGDQVVAAGPIWSHALDAGSQALTVHAAGLLSILDHRIVMGAVATGAQAAAWSATYTGSLADIARDLIALALSHTHGELPIDLPDAEGGGHTRTYYGYDLGPIGQRLDELMDVDGGPDLALEPYITPDRMGVRWRLRAGTSGDPLLHQPGPDWVLDATVPHGAVHGIGVARDATRMASRSWVSGEGSQEALLMEVADDDSMTSRGWPLLETVEARHTIQQRETAARWARGNLAAAVRPWTTWSVAVHADALSRNGGLVRPGDFVRLWVPESHPYLRLLSVEGEHRGRVLSIERTMGATLAQVSLAPEMEVR